MWAPALLPAILLASSQVPNQYLEVAGPGSVKTVFEGKVVSPHPVDDIVMSLDARAPEESVLTIEARAVYPDHKTKFYTLAVWSEFEPFRTSKNAQSDPDGTVYTDTWILERPTTEWEYRVTATPGRSGFFPTLHRLGFSAVNSATKHPNPPSNQKVWGKVIPVPKFNQGDYANGGVLCSPTSLTMILNYYGAITGNPKWRYEVPTVQTGVYDQTWGGTGNWTFNTAFACQQGFRSFVTRLHNLSEAEAWIEQGLPIATSVSYGLLRGKGKREENDGHLVVLVGFTKEGDPIFNDPGSRALERHIYKRADFEAAWAVSRNTVYIVAPPGTKFPARRGAPWPIQ